MVGGGSIVIARKFSVSRFWDDIYKYKVTIFHVRNSIHRRGSPSPILTHWLLTVHWRALPILGQPTTSSTREKTFSSPYFRQWHAIRGVETYAGAVSIHIVVSMETSR